MALINCTECNKEISDKAPACPHCGAPQNISQSSAEEQAPTPKPNSQPKKSKTMDTLKKISAVVGLLLLAYVIFIIYINNNGSSSSDDSYQFETYEGKVMSVEEEEQRNPSRFLEADGSYNQNLWGTKMTIHGKVVNTATVANFKDVIIEVTFYSKTNTELGSERYVLYENVPANSTKNFQWKVEIPRACKKLGWEAVDAVPY